MDFRIIFQELLLGLILYFLLTFLKKKNIKTIDMIILPSIYLILISAIIPSLKDISFWILVIYFGIELLSLAFLNKKDLLMNEKNYYKNIFLTLLLGFLIYYFFLLRVDNAFLDMNIFKNFVWLLIILYALKKLDVASIKIKEQENSNFDLRYQEYVIVSYAKLKNKYNYLIRSKDKEIENILYSFLIYEDYLHGKVYRMFRNFQNRFNKENACYGIMGVVSDHFITDEESIVLMKERLEAKKKRIKKSNNKDEDLKKLINEKYKETKNYKEIVKIIGFIEEFNKEEK